MNAQDSMSTKGKVILKRTQGGYGHISVGNLLRSADGYIGEIVDLADNNRWAKLRIVVDDTVNITWVMVRNCTKVE